MAGRAHAGETQGLLSECARWGLGPGRGTDEYARVHAASPCPSAKAQRAPRTDVESPSIIINTPAEAPSEGPPAPLDQHRAFGPRYPKYLFGYLKT